jgi:hypothetical protein
MHNSRLPTMEAVAHVQQPPKFKAAGCLALPKRE